MSSQAEMQRAMGEIQTMLRRGLRRKNSTSSLYSIASFALSINSKETWKELFRDLHKAGVTAGMIRERKDQIVDFFRGSSPPVAAEEPKVYPELAYIYSTPFLKQRINTRTAHSGLAR